VAGRTWLLGTVAAGLLAGGPACAQMTTSDLPVGTPGTNTRGPDEGGAGAARRPLDARLRAPGDPRTFILQPRIGLQETFTDNVNQSSTDRESDFITRGYVGLQASISSTRAQGYLDLTGAYDAYANTTNLNGFSASGYGVGSYAVLQDLLSLEVSGGITNGNISTFGDSAVDRSGTEGRTQVSTVGAAAHLTTTIGSFADLDGLARASWVTYKRADGTTDATLRPDDSSIAEVSAIADTAARFTKFQLVLQSQYTEDDDDFKNFGASAAAFYSVAPRVRLIGRVGYDDIHQPIVLDIQSEFWRVGFEYKLGGLSHITVEGGRRYNRPSYAADVLIEVSGRFYMTGAYAEEIKPDQVYINDEFLAFANSTQTLPELLVPDDFLLNANLLNETSLNKVAEAHAVYVWPSNNIDLSVVLTDRELIATGATERVLSFGTQYSRQIRPDLRATLNFTYDKTLDSQLFGESRSFDFGARLFYNLNPSLTLSAGYFYANDKRLTGAADKFYENAAFVAVLKTF
jgi:uncharacterized protein (PEP-CTERM system associated)